MNRIYALLTACILLAALLAAWLDGDSRPLAPSEAQGAASSTGSSPKLQGSSASMGSERIRTSAFSGEDFSPPTLIEAESANTLAISGVVIGDSGQAVEGALIQLHSDPLKGEGIWVENSSLRSVVTGRDGKFQFGDILAAENYRLRVQHPDYCIHYQRPIRARDPISLRPRITLRKGNEVTGFVRTPTGDPIAHAAIEIFSIEAAGSPPLVHAERSTASAADGRFRIANVSSGTKRLVAHAKGFSTAVVDVLHVLEDTPIAPVHLVLEGGLSIAGTVRNQITGQPAQSVQLVARLVGVWRPKSQQEGGGKALDSRRELKAFTSQPLGTAQPIDPNLCVPVASPDGSISFQAAWPSEFSSRAHLEIKATTDANGRFELPGLIQAEYALSIDDPFYSSPLEWVAMAGTMDLEVRAEARPTISGRVIAAHDRTPVQSFMIAVAGTDDPALVSLQKRREVRSADGSFGPLAARGGPQFVHIWANGFVVGTQRTGLEPSLGEPQELVVSLHRGATASGVVRGPTGEAVEGARIHLITRRPPKAQASAFLLSVARGNGRPVEGFSAVTSASGEYSLSAVPAGRFSIRVIHDSLAEQDSAVFTSEGKGSIAVADIALQQGFEASGLVRGSQASRQKVLIIGSGDRSLLRILEPKADGTFRCGGLPEGSYRAFAFDGRRPNPDRILNQLQHARSFTLGEGQAPYHLALGENPAPIITLTKPKTDR